MIRRFKVVRRDGRIATSQREEFVSRIRRQQQGSGYELAYLAAGTVKAVAGFRISENLAWGKFLYVDDLVAGSSDRSQGYGGILFDWLVDYARAAGCDEFHLDSGVQRFDAHRFYLRMDGYRGASLWFEVKINSDSVYLGL